jgi:hypothetical protein
MGQIQRLIDCWVARAHFDACSHSPVPVQRCARRVCAQVHILLGEADVAEALLKGDASHTDLSTPFLAEVKGPGYVQHATDKMDCATCNM